jgi:hypothetical protein
VKDFLVCWGIVGLCFAVFGGTIYLCVNEARQDCYRGSTRYVDCNLFDPCERPRIIDPAVEYAKRHPECR